MKNTESKLEGKTNLNRGDNHFYSDFYVLENPRDYCYRSNEIVLIIRECNDVTIDCKYGEILDIRKKYVPIAIPTGGLVDNQKEEIMKEITYNYEGDGDSIIIPLNTIVLIFETRADEEAYLSGEDVKPIRTIRQEGYIK